MRVYWGMEGPPSRWSYQDSPQPAARDGVSTGASPDTRSKPFTVRRCHGIINYREKPWEGRQAMEQVKVRVTYRFCETGFVWSDKDGKAVPKGNAPVEHRVVIQTINGVDPDKTVEDRAVSECYNSHLDFRLPPRAQVIEAVVI